MREPKDLPASIIKRIPIRLTYDDNYFNDTYQGIPIGGYTNIFSQLLEGCNVELNCDFFKRRDSLEKKAKKIVYTGKIDQFFDFTYGELEYRSLRFEHNYHKNDFQGNSIINYTEYSVPWTRITEHKHFQVHNLNSIKSSIYTKEYPEIWTKDSEPFYPINDKKNQSIYQKYDLLKKKQSQIIFGGRLAEYKYYDMHQVIASALHKSKLEFNT